MNSFLNDIRRITDPLYIPSAADITLIQPGKSIPQQETLMIGQLRYRFTSFRLTKADFQRGRKWLDQFEDDVVHLFVIDLSLYVQEKGNIDDILDEEKNVNLRDDLYIFESIVKSKWFTRQSQALLFMNVDRFEKQMATIASSKATVADTLTGDRVERIVKNIMWTFNKRNKGPYGSLNLYPYSVRLHYFDANAMNYIVSCIQDNVTQRTLEALTPSSQRTREDKTTIT